MSELSRRSVLRLLLYGPLIFSHWSCTTTRAHCKAKTETACQVPIVGTEPLQTATRRRLQVLTWNVWLMPSWLPIGGSPCNQSRAAAIAEVLKNEPFDILCLEKVFDSSARSILQEKLASAYPYHWGPANPSLLVDSGLFVLSKLELSHIQDIEYRHKASVEVFAKKGAMLFEGNCEGQRFQLLVTHLQGEECGRSYQEVRDKQISELNDKLVALYSKPDVPLFICGDFDTSRFDRDCHPSESYQRILSVLGVENDADYRITLDDDRCHNDLATDNTGRTAELDYVFVRSNGVKLRVERARHIYCKHGWDSQGRVDLSYRYAVGANIDFL